MNRQTMATMLKAADYETATTSAETLRITVRNIKAAVGAVGMKLTGEVLAEVSSAFEHLAAAFASTSQETRKDQLSRAGSHLTRLTNNPVRDRASDVLTSLSAEEICALGNVGNYYYSLICKEPRQALIDAYLCTERFPALGVQMFPPGFFSRDYRPFVRGLSVPTGTAGGRDWRGYALEKAWRVPAAGGMLVLGLLAGAAGHGADIVHGAMRAREILADGDYGLLPPREGVTAERSPLTLAIESRYGFNGFLAGVRAESRERRLAVEALR